MWLCALTYMSTTKKDILEKVTELRVFCVSNQNDGDNDNEPTAAYCGHWLVRCYKPVFIHMIKLNACKHTRIMTEPRARVIVYMVYTRAYAVFSVRFRFHITFT